MFKTLKNTLIKLKKENPLVLNLTNEVTVDFVANGLLSLGASPIMSKAPQEMDDLLQLASVLVVNIGTLDDNFVSLCEYACDVANQLKKPIVLDPVGAGASQYRTTTSLNLINNYDIAIIRANASEIMALSGASMVTKGVDSTAKTEAVIANAKALSSYYDSAIVISGEVDIVIDNNTVNKFTYGSALMPKITGTGCLLSAVVAAFHAIEKNRLQACSLATVFYGLCGEKAGQYAKGPAAFKTKFIDELALLPELIYEK